jgi:hypothetical protein|nr:MAG TPA: hypothetical protein [Bacteriophage sp.]
MERLTKTYSDGTHGASDSLPCGENSYDYKNLLIEKLGKYEDLEEQGRLVKLPCKVGDTVYLIKDSETITECKADMVFIGVLWEEFGKEWFPTRDEAEAKLKELRGGEDD